MGKSKLRMALDALKKLGDSSGLGDRQRNRLEQTVRQGLYDSGARPAPAELVLDRIVGGIKSGKFELSPGIAASADDLAWLFYFGASIRGEDV